jgi:hypothetical protein
MQNLHQKSIDSSLVPDKLPFTSLHEYLKLVSASYEGTATKLEDRMDLRLSSASSTKKSPTQTGVKIEKISDIFELKHTPTIQHEQQMDEEEEEEDIDEGNITNKHNQTNKQTNKQTNTSMKENITNINMKN